MCRCWYISAPGTRYSLTRRKENPTTKCGFNGALPIENNGCWVTRLSSTVRTRQADMDVQAYSTLSRVCMREILFAIQWILNKILRLSSVHWCWLLSLFFSSVTLHRCLLDSYIPSPYAK
jgi:hypothetical protein